jgi:hypothetical protein
MTRRNDVLDRFSPAWHGVFGFFPAPDECPAIVKLQAIGVREVAFQSARTGDGQFFTNVIAVVPVKGQAVDVAWLKEVRECCEAMGPLLDAETIRVAGPDSDDAPETDCRGLVSEGDLLLFVRMRLDRQVHMSAEVVIPSIDVVKEPVAEEPVAG